MGIKSNFCAVLHCRLTMTTPGALLVAVDTSNEQRTAEYFTTDTLISKVTYRPETVDTEPTN